MKKEKKQMNFKKDRLFSIFFSFFEEKMKKGDEYTYRRKRKWMKKFKYFVYNNEDQDCMYLLKTIIETVTPIRCKELHVVNSELIPSRYGEKNQF